MYLEISNLDDKVMLKNIERKLTDFIPIICPIKYLKTNYEKPHEHIN